MGQRYPLLLGAIGLALGAAAGGAFRPTETEQRVIGPLSDKLKQRALEVANEQYAQVRETAEHLTTHLQSRFGAQSEAEDRSSDFETVIGGGKPAVQQGGDTAVVIERSGSASPGVGKPGGIVA